MTSWLNQTYFNNTVLDYLIAAGIIAVGFIVVRILRAVIIRRLKSWSQSTKSSADDFIVRAISRFGVPALYYFVIYNGISYLNLSIKAQRVLEIATAVVVTFFILRLLSSTILMLLENRIRKQERGNEKVNQLGGLMIVINIVIWVLGFVFLVDNLGYDVTTIITGLGIGGIAVALAAQNILGDLFNYFVIFFDRPFEVGDFIIVDDKLGTVEYIGIKTTRLRALSGEQIVIGNSNLTTSRIHNFKQMPRRRVVFTVDVQHGTELEKLKEVSATLRRIVEHQDRTVFDRAHLAKFHDWSLRFEIVYYVLSGDYNIYMDIQEQINFEIYQAFADMGVRFAFPTQTLNLPGNKMSVEVADASATGPAFAPTRVEERGRR